MSHRVNLSCLWGRAPSPVSNVPQVNYLLVTARPVAPLAAPVPLNFCLVLDRSGSMKGEKLANLKRATMRLIDLLTPQDIVSLVIFDDTVQVVVPATPATDKAALKAQVDTIEESGGTAMSLGLQAGQAELRTYAGDSHLSHLLVLTDGQTWGDEDTCRDIARSLGQAGVRVTALGLGAEWNEQLLDDLAELTGGTSDYIATPEKMSTFFQHAIQSAQGTAARNVHLLLRLVREVDPRAVYRVTPTIANLGTQPVDPGEVAVRMNDLVYGEESSILFELLVPPRPAGSFRVAQAEFRCVPVGLPEEALLKQDVVLDFAADTGRAAYHPRVMNLVEKVTAFKLQTRALEEAEGGNTGAATQKLRAAATRLLDLGEMDLAEKARQQAEQLEQGTQTHIDAEAQKALRYATRRLTQKLDD
ncbi:MAG: VWA domain-containing protein [Chloroflexaceae bacterium]|nr:VWA domain-containing protein [Chloroflexaceae bacterium]